MQFHRPLPSTLIACAMLLSTSARAGEPDGLDGPLQRLAAEPRLAVTDGALAKKVKRPSPLVMDAAGRVLVTIRLTHEGAAADTLAALRGLDFKFKVQSAIDPRLIVGHLPATSLASAQALPGVSATLAAYRPLLRAGAVQSQAVAVQRSDVAQSRGHDGKGIRVGALSDSFDIRKRALTHAADDIASGDLPAEGVTVLEDAPLDDAGFVGDEGRAMLQLVHDIAPGATLGYAAAGDSSVAFANNILALRNQFHADIIVDDVGFIDEPFYSDGIVSAAVDQVVASGAAYFAAVGNSGMAGYESVYQPMAFADALELSAQGKVPVKLSQIPSAKRPRSVHVFGSMLDGRTRVAQRLLVGDFCNLAMQWDEPFNKGLVKTDYDLYFFDQDGNWIDPKTSKDIFFNNSKNVAIDQPLEAGTLVRDNIYLVVGKRNTGTASRIKYILNGGACGTEDEGAATAFGHVLAKGTFSVGATEYWKPMLRATWSSPGPGVIYFDADGHRLKRPEYRDAPKGVTAQGTDTTFFGYDFDDTGYPNFAGTSASAPVAAGVAAQVLQAAGGSGSLSPSALYELLQTTARPIPVPDTADFGVAKAGPVTLTVNGYNTLAHGYFRVDLKPKAASPLKSISIDLTSTDYIFAYNASEFGFSDGLGITAADITPSVTDTGTKITLAMKAGSFKPGDVLSFRWVAVSTGVLPGDANVAPYDIRGAKFTAILEDGTSYTGKLGGDPAQSPNRFTGWGLLDAAKATRQAPRWQGL